MEPNLQASRSDLTKNSNVNKKAEVAEKNNSKKSKMKATVNSIGIDDDEYVMQHCFICDNIYISNTAYGKHMSDVHHIKCEPAFEENEASKVPKNSVATPGPASLKKKVGPKSKLKPGPASQKKERN